MSTRTKTKALDAQVIAGIQKHLRTATSLPLLGSTYTPADLAKLVQSRIDSANGTAAAKANWHSTVVEGKTLNTQLTPVIRALRQHVVSVFGDTSPVLADFGFTPPKKRAALTPEQKAASAAKAKATRAARKTMGKVQKKGVKGAVVGITVTPITASPTVTASPNSPSPAPTSTGPTAAPAAPHTG
jgi:hypothetical protein